MVDLDAFLSRADVGTLTINKAANGKIYATVHNVHPDGRVEVRNQWANSAAEALTSFTHQDDHISEDELLI